jgi:signal peptidase II
MIVIQIIILTAIILLYRYFSYLWIQGKKYLYGMLIFYVSGITCSFIDVIFWGGSIDFLRLFDWFTFDLKDVYLDCGTAFLLLYMVNYEIKIYHKMNKAKRKQTGILIWIRKGMPNMPTE